MGFLPTKILKNLNITRKKIKFFFTSFIDFLKTFFFKKIFTKEIIHSILLSHLKHDYKNGIHDYMMSGKQDAIQLLNTAVIKSKEKRINASYEERLAKICNSAVMNSILVAIDHLAEEEKMSKDQAAISIVETVRELDSIWNAK